MAISHPACNVAFLIPGPFHSWSPWPLWACGFVDRAKPNHSVGGKFLLFSRGEPQLRSFAIYEIQRSGCARDSKLRYVPREYLEGVLFPRMSQTSGLTEHGGLASAVAVSRAVSFLFLPFSLSTFVLPSSAPTLPWPRFSSWLPRATLIICPVPQDSDLKVKRCSLGEVTLTQHFPKWS